MAGNEIKLTLRVDDDGSLNIVGKKAKQAADATDKLDKSTKKASKSRSNYNKQEKGVAGATSNSTKAFSKMRGEIGGGLVPAYAVLAANVFAVTAAFGALQRAAQVEQLTAGLSALGRASGLAMQNLSQGLVEATGNALSLEEAMRSTALITSAGLDPSSIERFGEVARNASVALGRDTADSLARLTRGVTKLEPELLDELGIMVRIDEATESFASSLGKTASELSNFEKRQAFLNAALTEGESKFGAIGSQVDTNPYDKLAATFQNLSKTIFSFVNNAVAPLVSFLASSPTALFGVLTAFAGTVITKMVPSFEDLSEAAKNSAEQTKELAKNQLQNLKGLKGLSPAVAAYAKALDKGEETEKGFKSATTGSNQALSRRRKALEKLSGTQSRFGAIVEVSLRGNRDEIAATKETIRSINQATKAKQVFISASFLSAKAKLEDNRATIVNEISNGSFIKGLKQAAINLKEQTANMTTYASKSSLIGAGNIFMAGTFTLAGSAATYFGAAISRIAPWITIISVAISILAPIISFLSNLFTSEAQKKYDEQAQSLSATLDELTVNATELDRALQGQSATIQTASQRWTAFANILEQFQAGYSKLSALAPEGEYEEQEKAIDRLLQSSATLRAEFAKDFGGAQAVDELAGSQREQVSAAEAFIEKQFKGAQAVKGLSLTLKEGAQVFSDFLNASKVTTPLDNIVAGVKDITKQMDTANKMGVSFGGVIGELSTAQATVFNVEEETSSIRNFEAQVRESQDRVAAAAKKYGDGLIGRMRTAKVAERENALQEELNSNIEEQSKKAQKNILASQLLLEADQKRLMAQKQQINTLKLSNQLLEATYASGEALAVARLDNEESIRKLEKQGLDIQLDRVRQTKSQTKDQAQITALTAQEAELLLKIDLNTARKRTETEKQLEIQKELVVQLQTEQKFKKAMLAIDQKASTIENNRISIAEKQARLAQKQANIKDPSRSTGAALLPSDELAIAETLLERRLNASRAEEKNKKAMLDMEFDMLSATLRKTKLEMQVENEKRKTLDMELIDLGEIDAQIASLAEGGTLRESAEAAITESYVQQRAELQYQVDSQNKLALLEIERINESTKLLNLEKQLVDAQRQAVSGLQEAARIRKEIAELENTRIDGSVRSAIEAARIEEESRQEKLRIAEKEHELLLAGIAAERNLMDAKLGLLIAEANRDDIITEQEQAIIAATAEVYNATLAAQDTQIANSKTNLGLLERQLQLEGDIASVKAGQGGGVLAAVQQMQGRTKAIEEGAGTEEEKNEAKAKAARAGTRAIFEGMATDLATLGPQGEVVSSVVSGALAVSDAWGQAFKEMSENGGNWKESTQSVLGAVGATMSAIGEIQAASSKAAIANIDEQIAAERKRDGSSEKSVAKIAALEKKKDAMARKQFEQNKKMQMAQTVINTGSAIMGILANEGAKIGAGAIAMAALVGAMGAAQLAMIASTSYQGGGSISSGSNTPSSVSMGKRSNVVDVSQRASGGELAYMRGARGTGTSATDFRPAFTGAKYRASGGETAGYVVGEQGPELFVPETPGRIVPNDDIAQGAPVNVTFSVQAIDANSFNDALATQRGNIISMIREAANSSGEGFLETVDTNALQMER